MLKMKTIKNAYELNNFDIENTIKWSPIKKKNGRQLPKSSFPFFQTDLLNPGLTQYIRLMQARKTLLDTIMISGVI